MEPWIIFTIWAAILLTGTIVLKLLFAPFMSALVMSSILASAFLIAFNPYHISNISIEVTMADTAKTLILIGTALLWVIWTIYQIFRDKKHRVFCYHCRVKNDLLSNEPFDPIQYDIINDNDDNIDNV